MKARIGFVSNSSTTSFLVLGFRLNRELIKKVYEQLLNIELDPNMNIYDIMDYLEKPLKEKGYPSELPGNENDFYGFDSAGERTVISKEKLMGYIDALNRFKEEFEIEEDWMLYHSAYVDN